MKKISIILFIMFFVNRSHAQTWDEWFNQKSTQKKYLLQQIAAFEAYLSYAKKGYDIANKGISTISSLKKGEFNLHQTFFGSLKIVNPKIKNAAIVADIIALQISIIQQFKRSINSCKKSGQFNNDEVAYVGKVYADLITECLKDVDELISVTTDGELQMKDDERIKRITAIHTSMQDKYTFTQSFTNESAILVAQRMKEQNDMQVSKILNNVK